LVSGYLRLQGEDPGRSLDLVGGRGQLRIDQAPSQGLHPQPGERPPHHAAKRSFQKFPSVGQSHERRP